MIQRQVIKPVEKLRPNLERLREFSALNRYRFNEFLFRLNRSRFGHVVPVAPAVLGVLILTAHVANNQENRDLGQAFINAHNRLGSIAVAKGVKTSEGVAFRIKAEVPDTMTTIQTFNDSKTPHVAIREFELGVINRKPVGEVIAEINKAGGRIVSIDTLNAK